MTERLRNAAGRAFGLPSYVVVPAALATSGLCFLLAIESVAPGTARVFFGQVTAVLSVARNVILANPLLAGLAIVLVGTVLTAAAVLWMERDEEAQP